MKLLSQTCKCGRSHMVHVNQGSVEYWSSQAKRIDQCPGCGREFRKLEEYMNIKGAGE